jgi:purine-nucleoside phosphorylase
VVLGSGLSWLAGDFGTGAEIDNAALPGMGGDSLPGHPGKVIQSADGNLVFLLGRRHGYQGFDGDQVSLLPCALADLGVARWVLTSSSGAVDGDLSVGDAVLFRDHLNLSGTVCSLPPGRPARCYRPELRRRALRLAREMDAPVREGVFACCSGPEYETAAEVRLLRRMGASTVSMSTAPEALALASQGCAVLAMSLVTNAADTEAEVSHREVLKAQELVSARQGGFLRELLSGMGRGEM